MRVAVEHNTTRDRARRIVDQKLQTLLGQFGHHTKETEHEWTGDVLRFKGKAQGLSIEGTVEITDQMMIVDAKLPLLAKPFEGRIRQTVETEAANLFRTA
ncbi:MAG TPA: polyhydroxyalkanoic acid system family protein [Thermoanaerobaculia bacterium]